MRESVKVVNMTTFFESLYNTVIAAVSSKKNMESLNNVQNLSSNCASFSNLSSNWETMSRNCPESPVHNTYILLSLFLSERKKV